MKNQAFSACSQFYFRPERWPVGAWGGHKEKSERRWLRVCSSEWRHRDHIHPARHSRVRVTRVPVSPQSARKSSSVQRDGPSVPVVGTRSSPESDPVPNEDMETPKKQSHPCKHSRVTQHICASCICGPSAQCFLTTLQALPQALSAPTPRRLVVGLVASCQDWFFGSPWCLDVVSRGNSAWTHLFHLIYFFVFTTFINIFNTCKHVRHYFLKTLYNKISVTGIYQNESTTLSSFQQGDT